MRVLRFVFRGIAAVYFAGLGPAASAAPFYGIGRAGDGDSFMVGDREVRLFGIDAPEFSQYCKRAGQDWPCGAEAAERLSRLIMGKDVRCVAMDTDQYGRTVARCTVDGTDINRAMVASGFAVAFRRYSTEYVSAEESARLAKRGMWAGTFQMPSNIAIMTWPWTGRRRKPGAKDRRGPARKRWSAAAGAASRAIAAATAGSITCQACLITHRQRPKRCSAARLQRRRRGIGGRGRDSSHGDLW